MYLYRGRASTSVRLPAEVKVYLRTICAPPKLQDLMEGGFALGRASRKRDAVNSLHSYVD